MSQVGVECLGFVQLDFNFVIKLWLTVKVFFVEYGKI